jgi:hypothetical protein
MARKFLTPIDLNKLELQNAAIQNLSTPPGTPTTGQVYYDTSASPYRVKIWNGTSWVTVGSTQEEIEDFVNGVIVAGTGISKNYDDNGGTLTIANTGVLSINGTTNEIDVSASTGSITISLPSTISADISGTAASATYATTAGTANTVAANSVALGTDTTGNYVATASAGTGISISGSGTESAAITITNTDTGSSQNIFKNFVVSGSNTVVADNNDDTITFVGSNGVGIVSNSGTDTIEIYNSDRGSAQEIFKTISVSGQSDIVADSNSDTLTVAGGTGITLTTNATTDTLTITNAGVTSITGTSNEIEVSASAGAVTVGLPDNVTVAGNLTVSGALTVSGSATYVNTEIIQLADNTIILNSNATGTASQDAGIEVERGDDPNVSVLWNETSENWTLTNDGTNYHSIARKYSADVGNSASTVFTLTHNLNTRDVQVQIYDNATYDTVECDIARPTVNTVTVTFAVAPSTNAYRAVIIG